MDRPSNYRDIGTHAIRADGYDDVNASLDLIKDIGAGGQGKDSIFINMFPYAWPTGTDTVINGFLIIYEVSTT